MAADKDVLAEEIEAFELHAEAMNENQQAWIEDVRFARLAEQWPEQIKSQRENDLRPCLTINRMPSFIRQIVNDSRQNKPQIKVKPVDNGADRYTADVIEGLVRNIEYVSKADVAYDTSVEHAVSGGFGYIRVAIDYEYDDSFDKGLRIRRVANPLTVFPDPYSTEADSSDWNRCFIVDDMSEDEFAQKYKGAEAVNWEDLGYLSLETPWKQEDKIRVAESWVRDKVDKQILLMSDGQVIGADVYKANQDYFAMMGIQPVNQRTAKSYKITQRIMTGAEILETNEWAGSYIPVIPVYGEELNVEGKRYFRSLIRDAKDAQRMFNYWRSTSTELVALAPRVPFIGEEGTFDADPNWLTSNSQSHAYLQYKKGTMPPQRQPLDSGSAAGAMTEAMTAADDLKAIMGIYDASLGAKSNETSGKAIMARQREGDVSSYHFIDNLARGIRHTACVLIDLIPKVYTGERVIRIIGLDGTESSASIAPGAPKPQADPQTGKLMQGVNHVYDLSVGKYDVACEVGPGYTTKRQEAADQMMQFAQAYPQSLPIIGDILVKALDWPQAEDIADRLKAMLPPQAQGGMDPQMQQMMQQGQQMIGDLQAENQQLKTKQASNEAKTMIDAYKAESDRLSKVMPYMSPQQLAALGLDTAANAVQSPDILPPQAGDRTGPMTR